MDPGTTRWLAVALAAGCAHEGKPAAPDQPNGPVPDFTANPSHTPEIAADLARLAALDVVSVVGVDVGAYDLHCYGLCPEDYEAMQATQGPRVHALAEVAERAARQPLSCEGLDADAELRALTGLGIVSIGSLVQEDGGTEDCRRLGTLAAINRAAKEL